MVEGAQSHADHEALTLSLDSFDDQPRKARAIFKAAAELARAGVGAKQFVAEVAVAMLDIDESEPDAPGRAGGADVIIDQAVDVIVADDRRIIVRIDAQFAVQDRVMIEDSRLELLLSWAAEAPAVRQLQTDQ